MNKKNLSLLLILIVILFLIGMIIYPIFSNSSKKEEFENNVIDDKKQSILQIDALSNLNFFKIIVEDTDSNEGFVYSEKVVTIRDKESVNKLQEMINSAEIFYSDDARGYGTPTTAICYLDDNSMCNFFVIDSNLIVFSDNEDNKTVYKLDEKYDIDKFLTTLYNVNVNASKYSVFSSNGKYGVKYSNNKTIISPKYDDIVIINPNVDVFAVTSDGTTTFIDKSEENPFPNFEHLDLIPATGGGESLWYENALKFKSNEKYGLASLDGSILLSAEYDDIEALNYEKDYLILSKNGKKQLIKLCPSGFEELTEEFDSIKILGADLDFTDNDSKYLYSDSTIVVGINNGVRERYIEISK